MPQQPPTHHATAVTNLHASDAHDAVSAPYAHDAASAAAAYDAGTAQLPTMQNQPQTMPNNNIAYASTWPSRKVRCVPEFRNSRRQRDVRVDEKYIPKVIAFLEARENVPKNRQPQWYQSALASYSITDRLKWIFEQDKPQDWIKPLSDASMQVIFQETSSTPYGTSQGVRCQGFT
eukprot:2571613-Amphidinium_carterae.1